MPTPVSFRPELVPISGSGIVPIKIKNPRGGLITIIEVDPNETTVGEVKQMLYERSTLQTTLLVPIFVHFLTFKPMLPPL